MTEVFSDTWVVRMLGATACLSILFAVFVIGIRVMLDGVGPEMTELTDALIKIALGGSFLGGGSLLAGRFIEGQNNKQTNKPQDE